jgi:hypothetical protein
MCDHNPNLRQELVPASAGNKFWSLVLVYTITCHWQYAPAGIFKGRMPRCFIHCKEQALFPFSFQENRPI